jgi:hypothetical protein
MKWVLKGRKMFGVNVFVLHFRSPFATPILPPLRGGRVFKPVPGVKTPG